jgi:hypothetical protein
MGVKSVVRPQQGVQKMARGPSLGWEGGGGGHRTLYAPGLTQTGCICLFGVFKHHPQQFGQSSWHFLSLEQPQHISGGTLCFNLVQHSFDQVYRVAWAGRYNIDIKCRVTPWIQGGIIIHGLLHQYNGTWVQIVGLP